MKIKLKEVYAEVIQKKTKKKNVGPKKIKRMLKENNLIFHLDN